MAAPTPQAEGRLLTVSPHVAELLAVKALGEGILGLVCLYLNANMAETGKFEYVKGFFGPWEGNKEQG
jgi:hypothetical protein